MISQLLNEQEPSF